MKKRLLSILTALCLCLTLLPGMARAENNWTGWTKFDGTNLGLSSGNYYLDSDVTISGTIQVYGTVTLDLNGHVLKMTGNGSVIKVNDGAELTLNDSDSSTEHHFHVEESGLWVLDEENGKEIVRGGVITGGTGTGTIASQGGGILVGYNNDATKLRINGGTIVGCRAYSGGGITIRAGQFIMNGGVIKGCVNTPVSMMGPGVGSALYFESGSMIANGGTVDGSVEDAYITTEQGQEGTTFSGPIHSSNIQGGRFFVKFDLNGGTPATQGDYSDQTVKYGEKVTPPANPSKIGYTFASWYNGDRKWNFNEDTVTGPMTLTAQWTANEYTITFDTDGGSAIAPITQDYGTAIIAPADPTRAGYTFAGWDKTIPSTMPAENVTIKAQWKANQYTITFDTNGGSEIASITQDYGTAITAPADPTRAGYTFTGWDKAIPSTMPAENVTIKAQWKVNQYTITFDTDGGSTITPITQDYGTAITVPQVPTKKGYVFAGWEPELPTTMPAENLTLKVKWTPDTHTFYNTYHYLQDPKEGGYYTVAVIGNYGTTDTEVTVTPNKYPGFTFNASKSNTTGTITGDGNLVLKLYYDCNSYAITYELDGGTNANDNPGTYTYSVELPLLAPTKAGYTFGGWYRTADFSTEALTAIPAGEIGDITLYAKWTRNSSGGSSSPSYAITVPDKPAHGSVTASPTNATRGSTVTITVQPDSGYVLETLTVTDSRGNDLQLTDKGDGKYTFVMPSGKVEVKATFQEDNSVLNAFYDVPNDAYYFAAVKWAVEKGITNGVSETLFGPDQPCTRAQIVTFLWRAAGSPVVNDAMDLTDVPADAYYTEAVRWALSEGITTGTGEGKFSPDETCTRAQGVTFLHRALGKTATTAANFTDVPADSYYAQAVAWAMEAGVTNGVSTDQFAPTAPCTRAQIVTFLYRAYQG